MTTPASSTTSSVSESGGTSPLYIALRVFAFVVLISMLVSIVYSGWIAIENWDAIRV